jgi:transposase
MQMTPGDSPEERESYWVSIIDEARRYPEGVTAYCSDCNISKNNYYSWFRKLRPKHSNWKDDLSPNPPKKKRRPQPKAKKQPETEVLEKATRRIFSATEKGRILKAADEASPGQLGAVLRKEGIYASHLKKWRAERAASDLEPKKRGPMANLLSAENRKLKVQNERLLKKLKQAEQIIELQKKVSEILGVTLQPIQFEDDD